MQKVDFHMVPIVKLVENTDPALQLICSKNGESTEKKKFLGISDLLFLIRFNDELGPPLFSSVQELYDLVRLEGHL